MKSEVSGPDTPLASSVDEHPVEPRSLVGTALGRYAVVRCLGAGGMGEVYEGRDAVLGRAVALKVLHASHAQNAEAQEALLREARALAKVVHPNVLPLYDVGEAGELTYLVVALCDGVSLRSWLNTCRPTLEAMCAVFRKAGAGLLAVHQAGLLHGDFKPSNVMCGRRGEVLVCDFGLARQLSLDGERRMGVGGTPSYMAPELAVGGPPDARSDQFSFSVALAEALLGQKVEAAACPREAPRGVPGPLWAAVLRGLSARPENRFPSLHGLLDALAPPPRRSRAWLWGAAAAALVLAASGAVGWRRGSAPVCSSMRGRLAAAWSPARIGQLRQALAEEPRGSTEAGLTRVSGFAQALGQELGAACSLREAFNDTELRVRRLDCLDGKVMELETSLDSLSIPGPRKTSRFVHLAAALATPIGCRQPRELFLRAQLPADPVKREALRVARAELVRSRARWRGGDNDGALASCELALQQARALGDAPQTVSALLWRGSLQMMRGEVPGAKQSMQEAARLAQASGYEGGAAHSFISLMRLAGTGERDPAAAEQWAGYAEAVLERLEHPPEIEAIFLIERANVRSFALRLEQALPDYERGLELARGVWGEASAPALGAMSGLASTLDGLGYGARALPVLRKLESLDREVYGAENDNRADQRLGLATLLLNLGRLAEGLDEVSTLEALLRRARGPDDPGLAEPLRIKALLLAARGDGQGALLAAEESARLYRQRLGEAHPLYAESLATMGDAELAAGRPERALALHRKAQQLLVETLGAGDPRVAFYGTGLASALMELRQWSLAAGVLERLLPVLSESQPGAAALARARLAEVRVHQRQPFAALELLKAWAQPAPSEGMPPREQARGWFTWARALEMLGDGRGAAEQARLAKAALAMAEGEKDRLDAELSDWLKAHPAAQGRTAEVRR